MLLRRLVLLLFMLNFLGSCIEAAGTRQTLSGSGVSGGGEAGSGNNITEEEDEDDDDDTEETVKVELRHLVEPKVDDDSDAGEYKTKLTIPKNYNGLLYVAGINISTLTESAIKVRFNFGYDSSPIDLDATITTGAGLTPQTSVQVLVIDMSSKPFRDINLPYDLYDYNSYDFSGAGTDDTALTEPVTFNRDDNLFCRGLTLANDPTYTGSLTTGCTEEGDICKYAYASVVDKGLVAVSGAQEVPIVPSEFNYQSGDEGYYEDANDIKLKRCLPDNPVLNAFTYTFDSTYTFSGLGDSVAIDGTTYIYQGPYSATSTSKWAITGNAIKGTYGLFGGVYSADDEIELSEYQYGYLSKLFPLYATTTLSKNMEYMGSSVPDEEKTLLTMSSSTETQYLDGCNARVTKHEVLGEHIGSCNVTASIQIIKTDDDGNEIVIDTATDVKLQLVPATAINDDGEDLLLQSFQQCSSTNQCGSGSCCINNRCWSKSLVSSCIEDLPNYGDLETGDSCSSDYECSSLCCNQTTGRCKAHDTTSENQAFCSKEAGQSCVAKEWCSTYSVQTCDVVDTGNDEYGNPTCELRCVNADVYGDCVSDDGTSMASCTAPCTPDVPDFDTSDPNRCDEAISMSELQEKALNPEDYCSN